MSAEDVAAEEEAAEQAAHADGADDGYETEGSVDPTPEGCVPSNTVEVHEDMWKRKAATPEDPRGAKARPTTTFKDLPVTFDTTELDIFEELMPVSWAQLLARVIERPRITPPRQEQVLRARRESVDGPVNRQHPVQAWHRLLERQGSRLVTSYQLGSPSVGGPVPPHHKVPFGGRTTPGRYIFARPLA